MSRKLLRFDPDWVVPPGDTLREWMDENGLTMGARRGVSPMGVMCGLPNEVVDGVLAGTTEVTPEVARGLERGTWIPERIWLNLERFYREGLRQGKRPL